VKARGKLNITKNKPDITNTIENFISFSIDLFNLILELNSVFNVSIFKVLIIRNGIIDLKIESSIVNVKSITGDL